MSLAEVIVYSNTLSPQHQYSFAATGVKVKSKNFSTRFDATSYMYNVMRKQKLSIREIYNDKHCKTYVCDNGIKFYISRFF